MQELTNRQQDILNYIKQHIKDKGYPPSVREIGKDVGLKSPASVHFHLKKLEKYNYIRRDKTTPRAIVVLDGIDSKNEKEMINIPIVGKITAGAPIWAEQNVEDYFPIPTEVISDLESDIFMLEVVGDSMIEAGIHDSDYVIAKKQEYAKDSDIVVALIDDEATVKRFYKEKEHIRLQPENQTMEPIILPDVKILGKVISLYRRFVN